MVQPDIGALSECPHFRHLPQEAGARILHDPRNAKPVANINDPAATTENGVALLSNINVGLPQTWQEVRVLIAPQSTRHRRVQRCTTCCRKRIARGCQHNAHKASGFGKLNNMIHRTRLQNIIPIRKIQHNRVRATPLRHASRHTPNSTEQVYEDVPALAPGSLGHGMLPSTN